MKQLFLALLAVGSITAANAQKGTILVYGTAGITVNNNDGPGAGETSTTNWNFNPGVGYQFHKNMTVGVQGGYANSQMVEKTFVPFAIPQTFEMHSEMHEWSVGAFYRYTHYFSPMFALWGQLDLSYISGRMATDTFNLTGIGRGTDNYDGFSAMITPALAINVHNGLALNFGIGGLGYRTVNWDRAQLFGVDDNTFSFTFGQQFNVGISKNFNCAKKRAPREPGMDTRGHKHDHDDDEDDE